MSPPNLSAPPATGPSPADIPAFADLAADPEIAPLLSFDPVVRKIRRPDGWTPELQRELIARLNVQIEIDTFARWAQHTLHQPTIVKGEFQLRQLARNIPLSRDYVLKEVDYILGRFEPEALENYVTAERTGRGTQPRVDRSLRRRLLDEVVYPYQQWLVSQGAVDWNGLAVAMARTQVRSEYEVVIVDESQDFSANQLRAIRHHLAAEHSITFVIDTVQRIYARGFTWTEAGYDVRPERY